MRLVTRNAVLLLVGALVAGAPATVAGRDAGPRLERHDGAWELRGLPPILDDEGVGEHLTTGLTTTLALRVAGRSSRGRRDGGALVTVRYELWDEVFEVAVVEPSRSPRRARLDSFEALESWWHELRVRPFAAEIRAPPAGAGGALANARLEIDVVPFSAAEERETRRWLSESLDAAKRSSTEGLSPTAEEGDDTLGRTFRLMMATSIRRRSVQEYRFDLSLGSASEETP